MGKVVLKLSYTLQAAKVKLTMTTTSTTTRSKFFHSNFMFENRCIKEMLIIVDHN